MDNLSKLFKHYILQLRLGVKILFEKQDKPQVAVEAEPDEEPSKAGRFKKLSSFLRGPDSMRPVEVFSSNNSLARCYSYGDMNDYVRMIEEIIHALMLDKPFNIDFWSARRSNELIRNVFLSTPDGIDRPNELLFELRQAALRLSESFELRARHPDIGVYVFQNLKASENILIELENFFGELFHDFRKPRS